MSKLDAFNRSSLDAFIRSSLDARGGVAEEPTWWIDYTNEGSNFRTNLEIVSDKLYVGRYSDLLRRDDVDDYVSTAIGSGLHFESTSVRPTILEFGNTLYMVVEAGSNDDYIYRYTEGAGMNLDLDLGENLSTLCKNNYAIFADYWKPVGTLRGLRRDGSLDWEPDILNNGGLDYTTFMGGAFNSAIPAEGSSYFVGTTELTVNYSTPGAGGRTIQMGLFDDKLWSRSNTVNYKLKYRTTSTWNWVDHAVAMPGNEPITHVFGAADILWVASEVGANAAVYQFDGSDYTLDFVLPAGEDIDWFAANSTTLFMHSGDIIYARLLPT